MKMNTVIEKSKAIPVKGKYDTVVVGGGIAGVSAALAAARHGAKTLLIETQFILGGLATAGLITYYLPLCDGKGTQLSFGIAEELLKLSISLGEQSLYPNEWLENNSKEERAKKRYETQFDANVFAILLEKILVEAGVEILYGTSVCSLEKQEDKISVLFIENRSGRSAIFPKTVIDASGDAIVCKMADEETAIYAEKNKIAAWYYELIDGKYKINCLGARDSADETEDSQILGLFEGVAAEELSQVTIFAHETILNHFIEKGGVNKDHSLATIATIPQVRMTRRLCGQETMYADDEGKSFANSVGMFGSWRKKEKRYELPYGCLISKKTKNLAVAGRCISAADDI